MRRTIDYTKSLTPKFDAVNDIMDYLGPEKYAELVEKGMNQFTNPRQFEFFCMLAGIDGFPVIAWYDHFHGEGAWDKALAKVEVMVVAVMEVDHHDA